MMRTKQFTVGIKFPQSKFHESNTKIIANKEEHLHPHKRKNKGMIKIASDSISNHHLSL